MTNLRNTVILASAGTGKTFALSGRYLRVLLTRGEPDRILATTFTRKAAGEILDRVLLRLARAAGDASQRLRLAEECEIPHLSQEQCEHALAALVQDSSGTSIGTLDSLFARLSAAFTFESGGSARRILGEFEDDTLQSRALLTALGKTPREHLLRVVRLLMPRQLPAGIIQPLRKRCSQLRGVFVDTPSEAWSAITPIGTRLTPSEIRLAISSLEQAPIPITKQGAPNENFRKSISKSCGAAQAQDWEAIIATGIGAALASGSDQYSRTPISADLRDAFQPLIAHARHTILTTLLDDTLATRGFVSAFSTEYESLKRRHNAATFDDLPRNLLRADSFGDLGHVYFRLDNRVDHLLVDEFQDTSATQYRLLRRFIDEITQDESGVRSFFAVGDVKQSLYQWRDAAPSILLGLPSALPNTEQHHLDKSYRSASAVISAVNAVFTSVSGSEVFGSDPAGLAAAQLWDSTFRAHTGLDRAPGFVRLRTAPLLRTDPQAQFAKLGSVAEHAASILRSTPAASIGILFQTHKHIPAMVDALQSRGLDASREGANTLLDSPAVCVALSAVRLADHPADSAAAFHLAHSAIAQGLGIRGIDPTESRRSSALLRSRFSDSGIARTLLWLRTLMRDHLSDADHVRYDALVDLAERYEASAVSTLGQFERLARSTKVAAPSNARVRVMTIHGSKGLEFDAVILPDLDHSLARREPPLFLIERDHTTNEINAVFRQHKLTHLLHPRLSASKLAQDAQSLHERLCVLYVAMTRARDSLDMVIDAQPPPKSASKSNFRRTFAGFLREKLAPDQEFSPAITLWQLGAAGSAKTSPPQKASTVPASVRSVAVNRSVFLRPPARAPLSQVLRRTPSGKEPASTASQFARSPNPTATLRGHLFHAWLQSIEWLSGDPPPLSELLRVGEEFIRRTHRSAADVSDALLRQWSTEFLSALAKPGLAGLFSRCRAITTLGSKELRVYREHRFAIPERSATSRDESLLVGQIDRVVVAGHEDTATAAEVIDFKTDSIPPDAAALPGTEPYSAIMSRYQSQLQDYRDAVATVFRIPARAVRASLFLISVDTRVILPESPEARASNSERNRL